MRIYAHIYPYIYTYTQSIYMTWILNRTWRTGRGHDNEQNPKTRIERFRNVDSCPNPRYQHAAKDGKKYMRIEKTCFLFFLEMYSELRCFSIQLGGRGHGRCRSSMPIAPIGAADLLDRKFHVTNPLVFLQSEGAQEEDMIVVRHGAERDRVDRASLRCRSKTWFIDAL